MLRSFATDLIANNVDRPGLEPGIPACKAGVLAIYTNSPNFEGPAGFEPAFSDFADRGLTTQTTDPYFKNCSIILLQTEVY